MGYLLEFSEASDRSQVGGKGFGLHLLTKWGLNVPPGFVITTAAFDEAVSSPPLSSVLSSGDAVAVRDAVMGLDLDVALTDEVGAAWEQLAATHGTDLRVSCRSSATAEDSAAASFAGQFTTVLGLAGPEQVMSGIKQCWASVWSNEVMSYRGDGAGHSDVLMAVVVQKMVRADAAGVAFSLNPVTGETGEVMINSNWGLGETVVSGLVTPDTFLVQRAAMEVSLREISQSKTVRHVVSGDGSVEEQKIPPPESFSPSLTDEQVLEIASLAVKAEEQAGAPQDIEWAIEAGELYVLQTRPVTTVW